MASIGSCIESPTGFLQIYLICVLSNRLISTIGIGFSVSWITCRINISLGWMEMNIIFVLWMGGVVWCVRKLVKCFCAVYSASISVHSFSTSPTRNRFYLFCLLRQPGNDHILQKSENQPSTVSLLKTVHCV